MSELVRKVHTLKREIFDLEQEILSWKSKYASEVNHAEDLSAMLGHLHLPCQKAFCSICNLLNEHEERRQRDFVNPEDESAQAPEQT